MSTLNWKGDKLKAAMRDAALWAVDRTMSDCVIHAKRNHYGWRNRTGTAEGSIRIYKFAERVRTFVVGVWGSQNVSYMIWLELKHGAALRSAADAMYPRLARYIKQDFARRSSGVV